MASIIGKDVTRAAQLLSASKLVAIPTETVYGLGANALDEEAVLRIFKAKNRPHFDPLIVHVATIKQASTYVQAMPEEAIRLFETFSPGPLTLLLPKSAIIPDLVTSGLERVAIRIPAHPLTLQLLEQLSFPIAAPSANPFGYISPTCPDHVVQQLGQEVDYILDGGACTKGIESTIMSWEDGIATIWRKGALAVEEIEAVIGPVQMAAHSSSTPQSPGTLSKHYAPRTPFILANNPTALTIHIDPSKIGFLRFEAYTPEYAREQQMLLSASADLDEAARNLFASMRKLDQAGYALIIAEAVPDHYLGRAINDRLRRAAATHQMQEGE